MRTGFLSQWALILTLLLAISSDGFFFDYPKKALMEFLQSLKSKKEAKKKPHGNDVHHYHVHYHPAPVHLYSEVHVKAPDKHELDGLHNDHLSSLGWSDYEYKFIPEPKVTVSSGLHKLWDDVHTPLSWNKRSLHSGISETIDHSEHHGVLIQVPLHQKIIIQHPPVHEKSKSSFLDSFFEKLKGSKNSVH